MSFAVTAGMAAMGAASAYMASSSANAQAKRMEQNALQQSAFQNELSRTQMSEQQALALEQQTELNRNFMRERGTMTAMYAEGETTGKSMQRIERRLQSSYSEVKAQYNRETRTNIINIAQGALANKIDTERLIAEARSKRVSPLQTAMNMVQGAASGASTGGQLVTSSKSGAYGKTIQSYFTE